MVSVYAFVGLDDGVQFMPADKKHYWRHGAYIPMLSGDFCSTAVDKGK